MFLTTRTWEQAYNTLTASGLGFAIENLHNAIELSAASLTENRQGKNSIEAMASQDLTITQVKKKKEIVLGSKKISRDRRKA